MLPKLRTRMPGTLSSCSAYCVAFARYPTETDKRDAAGNRSPALLFSAFHKLRKSSQRVDDGPVGFPSRLLHDAALIIAWQNIINLLRQLFPGEIFLLRHLSTLRQ